jgi:hypothetical protein
VLQFEIANKLQSNLDKKAAAVVLYWVYMHEKMTESTPTQTLCGM